MTQDPRLQCDAAMDAKSVLPQWAPHCRHMLMAFAQRPESVGKSNAMQAYTTHGRNPSIIVATTHSSDADTLGSIGLRLLGAVFSTVQRPINFAQLLSVAL